MKIVVVVCEVEKVDPREECRQCEGSLKAGAYLVLTRRGEWLNPAIVCTQCAKEAKEEMV